MSDFGITHDVATAVTNGTTKPQPTNGDRFRAMNDEELATELTKNPPIPCRMCEYWNNKLRYCGAPNDFTCVTAYAEALALGWLCQPCRLDWPRQPAKDMSARDHENIGEVSQ